MGINFSRVLTLQIRKQQSNYLKANIRTVISVGRVMTCVLGMVVRREREIREFCENTVLPGGSSLPLSEDKNSTVSGERWREALFSSLLIYTKKMVLKKRNTQKLIDVSDRNSRSDDSVDKIEERKRKQESAASI